MVRRAFGVAVFLSAMVVLGSSAAGQKHKGNSGQNETLQPDKTLYDRAVKDLQKNRFDQARLALQTLINTYPSSEYLAKAHLALAQSWLKQGGPRGLEQAQEECRQIMLQYPDTPEAKTAQEMLRKIQEPPAKRK